MKRLTVTLLVFSVFTPTVFAQTVEQQELKVFPGCVEIISGTERHLQCENVFTPIQTAQEADRQKRVRSGWLRKVEDAERDYKNKNGRYGNLAALRKAHLLRSLIFEPCSSTGADGETKVNFVPKSTLIQVTVSGDGQHFDAVIVDGARHCYGPLEPIIMPDFEDSPEGPTLPG